VSLLPEPLAQGLLGDRKLVGRRGRPLRRSERRRRLQVDLTVHDPADQVAASAPAAFSPGLLFQAPSERISVRLRRAAVGID
jgi:hypothetical protein